MTRRTRVIYSFMVCLLLSATQTFSQNSTPEEAVELYNSVFANQLFIYNGHVYKKIPEPYEGSPIFGDDLWNKGTIYYDGQLYENIDLFYDTYQDVLVVEHFDKNGYPTFFNPPSDKIRFFAMDGARFITIPKAVREANELPSGYFQELITGPLSYYAKRKTGLYDVQKQGKFVPTFKNEDEFYVKYADAYYLVKNKSSLKKFLKEYKKEINQYARERTLLFFPENREASLGQLVHYLNGIIAGGSQ